MPHHHHFICRCLPCYYLPLISNPIFVVTDPLGLFHAEKESVCWILSKLFGLPSFTTTPFSLCSEFRLDYLCYIQISLNESVCIIGADNITIISKYFLKGQDKWKQGWIFISLQLFLIQSFIVAVRHFHVWCTKYKCKLNVALVIRKPDSNKVALVFIALIFLSLWKI